MAPRNCFITAFAAAEAARTSMRRAAGSSMSVASDARVIVASVVASVLPASRNDTGTAAISDLRGTPPWTAR